MKKIFTLIIMCVAAISAMAQMHGPMNFIGNSDFYLPAMKEQSLTKTVKDMVTVTMGESTQSITVPEMYYPAMNMTIASFTINDLTYTMTGSYATGDMAFEWNSNGFTTTATDASGAEKQVTGTALKAKYTHADGTLTLEVTFTYGKMPMAITYEATGYYTVENKWELAGRGTMANPYRVFDADDFYSIATNYSSDNDGTGEYFLMMNDIDFGGSADKPAALPAIAKDGNAQIAKVSGGFNGYFEGDNHVVSGIYHTANANDASGKYNGLFGFIGSKGTVADIEISKNNHIVGYNYLGAIASINMGTISGCRNFADVTAANAFAGGICGFLAGGTGKIDNCTNMGAVKATTYATGIVGGSLATVTDYQYEVSECINNGSVSTVNGVGSAGIAGSYSGAIKDCMNSGFINDADGTAKSIQYTAGIVSAMNKAVVIENCTNDGEVAGGNNVAGIVANIMKGEGVATTVNIKGCTNNGRIDGKGQYVAGIAANSARNEGVVSLNGCTNNGEVTAAGSDVFIGNLRGNYTIAIGEGNTIAANLKHLNLDNASITAVKGVESDGNTAVKNGTYVKNGRIVIVKDGAEYNAVGVQF